MIRRLIKLNSYLLYGIISFSLSLSPISPINADWSYQPTEEEQSTSNGYAPEDPGLTDQEHRDSKNYVHEGLLRRTVEEKCKENKEACRGEGKAVTSDIEYIGGKNLDMTVEAVSKMYGMFFMTNKITYTKDGNVDEKKDYCPAIALMGETISQAYMMSSQQALQTRPVAEGEQQRESLYKAKENLEIRSKAAYIQFAIWAATAACYAAYIGAGFVGPKHGTPSKTTWAKMVAAGGLSAFYRFKYESSKEQAELVQNEIIDKLPGKGDCNPITQRNCYCAQPETRNDPKYCLAEIYQRRLQDKNVIVGCVNNAMDNDPECNCLQTNTCFDLKYKDLAANNMDVNRLIQSGALDNAFKISRGSLDEGQAKASARQNMAQARDLLIKNPDVLKPSVAELTPIQLEQAKALKKLGLEDGPAAFFATEPLTSKGQQFRENLKKDDSALALQNSKFLSAAQNSKANGGGNVLYFDTKNSKSSPGSSSNESDNQFSDLLKKFNQQGKGQEKANNVLYFDMAHKEAQIEKSPQRNIFDLLSQRYQRSTWEPFGVFATPGPSENESAGSMNNEHLNENNSGP